jgi:aspartyl-tRNA(Asn)/glutamyl-tRNA(Gln) amidotransferase subunit A
MMPPNPFERLSLAEFGARLRRRELSAAAVTESFLERIEALNPKLGAYTAVAADAARAQAGKVDALIRAGADLGPFMGVPVAVKDLYRVDGLPLTAGSRVDVSHVVSEEGPIIRALHAGGAVILGKTWTSEFALGGINFIQRVPWNPCDAEHHRTPGGSSGGSAVAMAAGLCALALGTDTGGSVRLPAALCGVFGHKFSASAFALEGIFPLSPTLDSPGIFTASAADAATVWQALAGAPVAHDRPLRGLRLAKPRPTFYDDLDDAVARALDAALDRLRAAGVVIDAVDVPEVNEFEAIFGRIVPIELIDILGRERVIRDLKRFDPVTQARFRAVLEAPSSDQQAARHDLARLRARLAPAISGYDAWITPTTPLLPSPLAEHDSVDKALAWNRRALRNTRPGNVFEQCGISLPLANTALPVGLQILCPAGEDAKLLAIAAAVERAVNCPG